MQANSKAIEFKGGVDLSAMDTQGNPKTKKVRKQLSVDIPVFDTQAVPNLPGRTHWVASQGYGPPEPEAPRLHQRRSLYEALRPRFG